MARVLVLNATYEPLAVVPMRRAVCLMLAEKVEVIETGDQQVRSEHMAIDAPSVVRLSRYVKVPHRRHRSPNRRGVLLRDEHCCQYCGAHAETVDHVIPRAKGGPHTWDNLVAACRRCNANKRDRLLSETSMRLARRPNVPPAHTWIELAAGTIPDRWNPYLVSQRRSA